MDLSAAIEAIRELSEEAVSAANKVSVISLPGEPPGVYGLVRSDGSFEVKKTLNPPRAHILNSVDQIEPFVGDVSSRFSADVSVWYDRAAVVVLLQDSELDLDKRANAKVPLRFSPEFHVLQNEAKSSNVRSPKEFILWIRRNLIDAIDNCDEFLKLLRSLKLHNNESAQIRNSQGRESLGLEVDTGAVSDFGLLPETVYCNVRVFDDPAIQRRVPIRCVLEVNPRTAEFALSPLAVDLVKAVDEELQNIGDLLTKSLACPVFYGTP